MTDPAVGAGELVSVSRVAGDSVRALASPMVYHPYQAAYHAYVTVTNWTVPQGYWHRQDPIGRIECVNNC